MTEPSPVDVAALLAEQPWVERVARGLVRDSSLAQDLAQEAWLRASARGPSEPGALRGFLAGVVRNLSSTTRRAEGRRERREAAVARPEALPSADELVGRAELQRILVECVLALEPDARTAILLRYFEGLSSEEIAARSGVAPGTIRSRVSRGLETLRARLEARVDRRDLHAGLLVLARLAPPAPPAGPGADPSPSLPLAAKLAGGLLAMKTLSIVAAGCAALVVAAGLWIVARDDGARGAEEPAPRAAERAPVVAATSAALEPAPEVGAERAPVEAPAAAPEAPAAEASSAPPPTRVVGRVVDHQGSPLGGAEVRVEEILAATSDALGRVELELAPRSRPDLPYLVDFARAGFARVRRGVRASPGAEVHLGDVALAPAAALRGRVEDEAGRPLAGVRLVTTGLENRRTDPEELRRLGPETEDASVAGTSGANGEFALADVPLGPARLWGGADALAWGSLGPLDVPADGLDGLVLVLRPLASRDRIRGRVVSPDGEPVPRARIGTYWSVADSTTSSSLLADEHGEFEIVLEQRVAYDLTATDPENRWSEVYLDGVEPGATGVELAFEDPRWIDVAVRDPRGAPLVDFALGLECVVDGRWLQMTPKSEPRGDGSTDGSIRLRVPNAAFYVTCSAEGREPLVRGPFEPDAAPASLVLEPRALPGVRGVVRRADGSPAVGAEVALHRAVPRRELREHNGFRLATERDAAVRATADAEGRFTLYPPIAGPHDVAVGELVLRASAPGHAPTELAPRAFDPFEEGVELELTLARGGALEGRGLVPPGVDPTGILLAFHRGDGRVLTQRLGPDGRYRVEGLTPGPWEVRALDDEQYGHRSGSSATLFDGDAPPFDEWSCVVVDGQTTTHDVDLGDRAPCALRGTLALSGGSSAGWTAALVRAGSTFEEEVLATVTLGADGRFELAAPRGGAHRLELRAPEAASGRLVLSEELALVPGRNEWRLELALGRVEGSGALGRGARERFYEYVWRGGAPGRALRASVRIVPDEAGAFLLPLVPLGPGKIRRNDPAEAGETWKDVLEFELVSGTRRVELF